MFMLRFDRSGLGMAADICRDVRAGPGFYHGFFESTGCRRPAGCIGWRHHTMRISHISLALACLCTAVGAAQGRLYVNDKSAPENRKDIEVIQAALYQALPAARAATVAVELKQGSGSGVIVSPDGLILTAAHVSMALNKKVTVIMEDGTRHEALTLGLVADTDAAMMRMTKEGVYPHVEMDRGNTTRLGDWVFSLGHSGGFDKERGLVVRLGRLVRIANNTVQSDCTLIGGDSGGPLFDLDGRLIAIHSRVGSNLQVNNHVPIREFLTHWERMLASEFIGEGPFAKMPEKGRGFIGVLTEAREGGGLVVTKVGDNTAASEAGITAGDVMISLNEEPLESKDRLKALLKEMAPGDEVVLVIERAGESKTLTFDLGER